MHEPIVISDSSSEESGGEDTVEIVFPQKPEKSSFKLEYIGERDRWAPGQRESFAEQDYRKLCATEDKNHELETEIEALSEENDELKEKIYAFQAKYTRCRNKKRERKQYIKQVEKENKELKNLIEKMTAQIQEQEANPKFKEECEFYKLQIADTQEQRDKIQQKLAMIEASFKVCCDNNEVVEEENKELTETNQKLAAASLKALDMKRRALDQKKKVNRCFMQVMRENEDVRDVLRQHLEQENKYRKRLHEVQLNIEEIMHSMMTAEKHRNDPDIDDFDALEKIE